MNLREIGAVLALGTVIASSAFAAGTSGSFPPPAPGSIDASAPPQSVHSLLQRPNPTHWYKFNGDLRDSVVDGMNLNPYTNNGGVKWEPGKDGTKNGSIRGYAFVDAKNTFIWPSFTIEFTVYPQSWNGKATGGTYACQTANVVSNAYHVVVNTGGQHIEGYQHREFISITGCPDDASDSGKVGIFWDLDAPNVPPGERTALYSHPLRSNMWHDISFIFDGTERKITLMIDGAVAHVIPVPGPFHVGNVRDNRLFVGMQSEQGWVPGIVDDLRFYGSAVYPVTMPTAITPAAPRSLAR